MSIVRLHPGEKQRIYIKAISIFLLPAEEVHG